MEYYAHTVVRADGAPDPDTANGQLLSMHLWNVCL
jgi:hypothetical protein